MCTTFPFDHRCAILILVKSDGFFKFYNEPLEPLLSFGIFCTSCGGYCRTTRMLAFGVCWPMSSFNEMIKRILLPLPSQLHISVFTWWLYNEWSCWNRLCPTCSRVLVGNVWWTWPPGERCWPMPMDQIWAESGIEYVVMGIWILH